MQVYAQVCAACHGLKRIAYRNLVAAADGARVVRLHDPVVRPRVGRRMQSVVAVGHALRHQQRGAAGRRRGREAPDEAAAREGESGPGAAAGA